MPFLGNFHFNVLLGKSLCELAIFVSLRYSSHSCGFVSQGHGSLYGTHPFLWYAYAGIPAICGIMLPFFMWEISARGPQSLLISIIVPYILLHSFSEHKEFRFLLPVLPIICILVGHAMTRLVHVMARETLIRRKQFATPTNVIFAILILLNYPHLLYLGLMHQRGPIAINHFLTSVMNSETLQEIEADKIRQYSIHYLLGCHSTPVYSHLHTPVSHVAARYLDCSPECRSNPDLVCESDAFLNDPSGFVKDAYELSDDDDDRIGRDLKWEKPSFIVVMEEDAKKIGNFLTDKLNMSHAISIRHTIKSLSLHRQETQCDAFNVGQCSLQETRHYILTLFSWIDVHFDHMEVYKS